MAIRDRLDRLRAQAGTAAPTAGPAPVARRIQRLRVRETRLGDAGLARKLGGEVAAPGLISIRSTLAPGTPHGGRPLVSPVGRDMDFLGREAGISPGALAFIDTETTGLSGGSGTLVFLLGLGRIDETGLHVLQLLLTRFDAETAMLEESRRWLGGTAALASYNGRSFDIPLLAARCRMAGVPDPFTPLRQVDLLHPVRRAFGTRWPDCRLQTAEQNLLQFHRRDDLPGAEAPAAWFRWLQAGDWGLLPAVVRHNHWDLVSLAGLLPALAEAYAAPWKTGADPAAVARQLLAAGRLDEAVERLARCGDALDPNGRLLLARLHRRKGQWGGAVRIWNGLADDGHPEALEHLAKYHEHVRRDYPAALTCARRLLEIDVTGECHRRRVARLERRCAGGDVTRGSGGVEVVHKTCG